MSREALYLLLALALIGSGAVTAAGVHLHQRLSRQAQRWTFRLLLTAYATVLVLRPGAFPLATVLVFGVGIAAGSEIGRRLSSTGSLAGFLVTVAVVDMVSFTAGPTEWIIDGYRSGGSDLLLYLTASFPLRGTMVPLIGVGDLFILATVWQASWHLGYRVSETALPVAIAMVVALGVGLALDGIFFLPFLAGALVPYLLIRRRTLSSHQ